MKTKNVFLTALLAAVLCISGNLWAANYSGGSGTQADPYKISTVADWQALMTSTADWGKHFILTTNLDLVGIPVTPIGSSSTTPFSGVFDGQDFALSNVVIHQTGVNYVGLFGCVTGGTISNLGLVDVTVSGQSNIGGLVGRNDGGSITACYATGTVSSINPNAGGLVGSNYTSGTITACYFRGDVSGSSNVGGLAGLNSSGTIATSYAFSGVTGTNSNTGGLAGLNYGVITSCYAIGDTSGTSNVGGLVGQLNNGGSITSSYAASVVSGTGSNIGGLVGTSPNGSVDVSFWDIEISRQETSAGGEGLTTPEMQVEETFLHAGWDFIGETENGTDDVWMITGRDSYPVFVWWMRPDNDLMARATLLPVEAAREGTSIAATGQDITLNGYNDWADVWYYFDCTATDKYTITLNSRDFDTTLAVFDAKGREIVFNDDFFGGKSVVILKARAGVRYYIRVAGYDGQRGAFDISLVRGAVQAFQGDLNYDGHVNLTDFAIFADNWLVGI
jgi:hypothetical protein